MVYGHNRYWFGLPRDASHWNVHCAPNVHIFVRVLEQNCINLKWKLKWFRCTCVPNKWSKCVGNNIWPNENWLHKYGREKVKHRCFVVFGFGHGIGHINYTIHLLGFSLSISGAFICSLQLFSSRLFFVNWKTTVDTLVKRINHQTNRQTCAYNMFDMF